MLVTDAAKCIPRLNNLEVRGWPPTSETRAQDDLNSLTLASAILKRIEQPLIPLFFTWRLWNYTKRTAS